MTKTSPKTVASAEKEVEVKREWYQAAGVVKGKADAILQTGITSGTGNLEELDADARAAEAALMNAKRGLELAELSLQARIKARGRVQEAELGDTLEHMSEKASEMDAEVFSTLGNRVALTKGAASVYKDQVNAASAAGLKKPTRPPILDLDRLGALRLRLKELAAAILREAQ